MDKTDLTSISALVSAVSAIAKGPRFLADWVGKRTEGRYADFIDSAKAGGAFPENAAAMTADDLFALLKALELDMEGEKAKLYGRLAHSIAVGDVIETEKRHFIRSLQDLTFDQAQCLRKALIARRFKLYPGVGSGHKQPKDFLAPAGPNSIDALAFQRWGLVGDDALTPIGERFVSACFPEDMLQPESIGEREWAPRGIHVVCNEMGDNDCSQFLLRLTNVAHGRAIRVTNGAANREHTQRPMFPVDPLYVLLTRDPARLLNEWDTVLATTRGSERIVVVTVAGAPHSLPKPLDRSVGVDASAGREEDAVEQLLQMLEQATDTPNSPASAMDPFKPQER